MKVKEMMANPVDGFEIEKPDIGYYKFELANAVAALRSHPDFDSEFGLNMKVSLSYLESIMKGVA
jgi:hypothetical protein